MANFSTWDRATLEQFAQEATDKLVEGNDYAANATAANIMQRERIAALEDELAELRKGEPVAVVNVQGGGVKPVVSWLRAEQLPAGSHKLYTSAPSIPEVFTANDMADNAAKAFMGRVPMNAIHAGWQLVPMKPTEKMLAEVQRETTWCDPVGIYKKLLAAAPKHTKEAA